VGAEWNERRERGKQGKEWIDAVEHRARKEVGCKGGVVGRKRNNAERGRGGARKEGYMRGIA
jgi:hypothetical protein